MVSTLYVLDYMLCCFVGLEICVIVHILSNYSSYSTLFTLKLRYRRFAVAHVNH